MAYKVFVDAGHGGADPGTVDGTANDPIYTEEADRNLDMALKFGAALKRCGVEVKQSRTDDKTLTLSSRSALSNAWGADVFVSWHCNGGPDGATSRGIEVFRYYGSAKGLALATAIYNRLDDVSPWADRGVKEAGFSVLKHTWAPAALIEAGFINNTTEEAALNSPSYRLALAEAAARGVCDYLGIKWIPAQPAPAPVTYLKAEVHLDSRDKAKYQAVATACGDFIRFTPTVKDSWKEW